MTQVKKKIDSKEVGLEIGLIFTKFFLKTDYLHYGYWIDGLETDVQNLKKAQENYTNFLLSNIPEGTKTILDVGCGSGVLAKRLSDEGYQVDGVSPAEKLTERARKFLGDRGTIFQGRYEDVVIEKKYDLILFSESFQYIDMNQSFGKSAQLLNENGHILICDFFRYEEHKHRPLGGGHFIGFYNDIFPKYPFNIIKELDITKEVAPTMDVVNAFTMEVIKPTYTMLMDLIESRFRWVHWFIQWKFKKKLIDFEAKQFKGERNSENFIKDKVYKLILLQKRP